MSRVVKFIKNFPKLFQPLNYKKASSKREGNQKIKDKQLSLPHLDVKSQKSYSPESDSSQKSHNNLKNGLSLPRLMGKYFKEDHDDHHHQQIFSKSESNLAAMNLYQNNNLGHTNSNLNKSNSSLRNQSNKENHSPQISSKGKHLKVSKNIHMSNSTSDVPRIVAGVIADASKPKERNVSQPTVKVERQMVRIINGCDPSCQSQILLNTKTSQPWEDLVKDLGMAVKLPTSKRAGNRLETLYGRKVQNYSQLRSELKVGNNAFYIYDERDEDDDSSTMIVPNLQRHRLSLIHDHHDNEKSSHRNSSRTNNNRMRRRSNISMNSATTFTIGNKIALAKTISTSSSELSTTTKQYLKVPNERRRRQRSLTPSSSPTPNQRKSLLENSTTSPYGVIHFPKIHHESRSVHF